MTTGQTGAKLPYKTLEPPEPKPILTFLLICAMPLCLADGSTNWIDKTAFTATQMTDMISSSNLPGLFSLMFKAALAQLSPWMWALNSFFVWCFGYVVEKKLTALKYMFLLLTIIISGWVAVFVTAAGINRDKLYIGPSMMMFGLLGAYFAFFPKKPFTPQQWLRPNTQIFNREEKSQHQTRWVSPWVYVTSFVVFQVLIQAAMMFDKDFIIARTHQEWLGPIYDAVLGKIRNNPSAFQPIAAIINIGVGFAFAQMMPALAVSMKPKRPGGKLQLEVIQHYRELRTLDMNHEQACEGAAKFAAVPIDIAKDWIAKGAAGLKDQDVQR
jgi:membrane associated rhomboid family serine protease